MRNPGTGSNRSRQHICLTCRRKCAAPVLVATILVRMPAFSYAAGVPSTEYRIKAAFLFNFTSFVSWPEDPADASVFSLRVPGDAPIGNLPDKLADKSAHGTQLMVRCPGSLASLDRCQPVYLSEACHDQIDNTLVLLHALPVLAVSDMRGFTAVGGIIEFRIISNRLRFDINRNAAGAACLSISSELLSLATRFRRDD
jgi:hypothetical protein